MTEKTYFKDCPECKTEGAIKGVYTLTNQGVRIQIKKCTECKYQVGLKQFEKLEPNR